MNLLPADQKAYPKFAEYIRNSLPKVQANVVIKSALKKYGHMTDAQIILALTWGQSPRIHIVEFASNPCGAITDAYGCTREANPDAVEIAKKYVQQFEANAFKGSDNKNARGSAVYVVGATLLHELCHWGNYKNGVAETKEMGLAFETAVYGKTIW